MKRPYRGVCMEGFDHILGDNFVIILIKGNVDKPIFFLFTSGKLSDLQLEGVLYAVSIIITLLVSRTLSTFVGFCIALSSVHIKHLKYLGKDGFPAKNKFVTKRPFQLLCICGSRECVIAQSWSLVIKSS